MTEWLVRQKSSRWLNRSRKSISSVNAKINRKVKLFVKFIILKVNDSIATLILNIKSILIILSRLNILELWILPCIITKGSIQEIWKCRSWKFLNLNLIIWIASERKLITYLRVLPVKLHIGYILARLCTCLCFNCHVLFISMRIYTNTFIRELISSFFWLVSDSGNNEFCIWKLISSKMSTVSLC